MPNEKKGFSKREKRLILILVFFGFTALMVMYVIIPFNNRLQDETERHQELTVELAQMQAMLNAAESIRSNRDAALKQFEEARERFFDEAHISEVGRMLTNLCTAHGLFTVSQSLSPPSVPAEWDAFMVMQASMILSGTYSDFMSLLDTVEHREYLRVTRLSFGVGNEYLESISLNFEVIMMQSLEG
jgi:acyl-CoA synthetase (AMP-forming)/AMP-acid ligase II